MTAPETEKTVCPQRSGEPASDSPKPPRDMAERRGMVLMLLFLVLGPLALPLLWRSSKFSPAWKIILTILVAIQTAAVVWLLWYVVHLFVESLKEYGVL